VTVVVLVVSPVTAVLTYDPDRDVRAGDTVVITVTFSRTVTGSPSIAIDTTGVDMPVTALESTSDGKVWTFSYEVPEKSDGQATVTIGGIPKESGSTDVESSNNKFNINSIGPGVALTYDPKDGVLAGETLTITATFDEKVTGKPTISINTTGVDLSATALPDSGDGKVWTFSYTAPANSAGEATVTIAGSTDKAGNPNRKASNDKFNIGPVKIGVCLSYSPAQNIVP